MGGGIEGAPTHPPCVTHHPAQHISLPTFLLAHFPTPISRSQPPQSQRLHPRCTRAMRLEQHLTHDRRKESTGRPLQGVDYLNGRVYNVCDRGPKRRKKTLFFFFFFFFPSLALLLTLSLSSSPFPSRSLSSPWCPSLAQPPITPTEQELFQGRLLGKEWCRKDLRHFALLQRHVLGRY